MKKYIFLGILLIIGGGIYYAATSYEGIVKNLVHKYGSEVTGTDVSLQGFKISLTEELPSTKLLLPTLKAIQSHISSVLTV